MDLSGNQPHEISKKDAGVYDVTKKRNIPKLIWMLSRQKMVVFAYPQNSKPLRQNTNGDVEQDMNLNLNGIVFIVLDIGAHPVLALEEH